MPERNSIESQVRDWLCSHLEAVDSNLKLIKKEYHLPDTIGARGFVDLLCKDQYDNFVIVEIKRSETAARQAISEVLKYHSLLQHNYSAKASEIRIIIVSTSWGELIRPFSETIHKTDIDMTGYRICLNDANIPYLFEKIQPLLPTVQTRAFSYYYGLYLFESDAKRKAFYAHLKNYLLDKGFKDFVLIEAVGNLENKRIFFPYGIILVFQKLDSNQLIDAIEKMNEAKVKDLSVQAEFDEEKDYIDYLEASLINAIGHNGKIDETESCYPQKINVMIDAENWTVDTNERFGIFSSDPRYSDELLIAEIRGVHGSGQNRYIATTESTQKEKMKEIQHACRNSLAHSPIWLDTVDALLSKLRQEKRKFTLALNIFNPDSLMVAIYHTISNRDLNHLPYYFAKISYHDGSSEDIYFGGISWNMNHPTSQYLKAFPPNENGSLIAQIHMLPDNTKDAADMGLNYTTAHYVIQDGKPIFKGFYEGKDGKLLGQNDFMFQFAQYAVTYAEQLQQFIENHDRSFVKSS